MANPNKLPNENWLKLACLVYDEIQPALLGILHNVINDGSYTGLPRYGPELYTELNNFRQRLTILTKKKVISKNQFDLLLPLCQSTDSSTFDITLLTVVIRTCVNIPAPSSWEFNSLDINDSTIASYIVRGKEIRNKICHSQPSDIDNNTFNTYWNEGKFVLNGLHHKCDLNALLTKPLDSRTLSDRVKLDQIQNKVDDLETGLDDVKSDVELVKSDLKGTTSAFGNITTDVRGIKSDVELVKSDLKGKSSAIRNITTDIGGIKSDIELIKSCFKDATSNIENHKSDVKSDLENVKSDMRSFRNTVENVQEALRKAEKIPNESTIISPSESNKDVDRTGIGEFSNSYKNRIKEGYKDNTKQHIIKRKFMPNMRPEGAIESKHSVLIQAAAGVGKTVYVSDMIYRWGCEEVLSEYFILNFDCKEMNKYITMTPDISPVYFSGVKVLSTNIGDELLADCKIMMKLVNFILQQHKLIVIIDGVDEVALEHHVSRESKDRLEGKIHMSQPVSGLETLAAIMFGMILPKTKIIISGRNNDIDHLKEVIGGPASYAFNRKERVELELMEFSDNDVKRLVHLKVCDGNDDGDHNDGNNGNNDSDDSDIYDSISIFNMTGNDESFSMDPKCRAVYKRFAKVEFKNTPFLLSHLIEIYKDNTYEQKMGTITKTKLFVAVIMNYLQKHTRLGSSVNHSSFDRMFVNQGQEFMTCLQSLAAISYHGILNQERKVIGTKTDGKYRYYGIDLDESVCQKLDIFYTRSEFVERSVEPRHMFFMEFLAAVHYALNKDSWNTLADLTGERKLIVLPFVAGLLTNSPFIKDFMVNCMGDTQKLTTNQLYEDLLGHVNEFSCKGNDGWHGIWNSGRRISFKLLVAMVEESHIPESCLLPDLLEFHTISSRNLDDMYHLKHMKTVYGFADSLDMNLSSLCELRSSCKITIKGDEMELWSDQDVSIMNTVSEIPQVSMEVELIIIVNHDEGNIESYNFLRFTFEKLWILGSHQQFSFIMNEIVKHSQTTPCIRELKILSVHKVKTEDMRHLLDAAIKVDMLSLSLETFTREQCEEISRVLQANPEYRKVKINVDDRMLRDVHCIETIRKIFYLHLSFLLPFKITDDILNTLTKSSHHPSCNRNHGDTDNHYILHQYEVDAPGMPLRKISGGCDYVHNDNDTGVLMLNLYHVDFEDVLPEMFATSLSNIPVVCISTNDDHPITNEQWTEFGKVVSGRNCAIRELRLWDNSIMDTSCLLHLLPIPLLQIVGNKGETFQNYFQFIIDNTMKKYLRILVIEGVWGSYNERVIFCDPVTKLEQQKLENKTECEMMEVNFEEKISGKTSRWVIELTNLSKDKCLIM